MKAILIACLALVASACSSGGNNQDTLKVAATSVPQAEILDFIKPDLRAEGIDLDVIVVEDYATPNRALADKEVDANYFQHLPFLEMQIKEFHYPLVSIGKIHLEPMGIYSKKIQSLKDLKDGSTLAIPNDPTNQARALELIEKQGLIKLKTHGINTTILDIAENPHQLKFIDVDPPMLVRTLPDVDIAVINANFAMQGGLHPLEDALALEDSTSKYANIIVVRKGDENRADIQALMKALQSPKVRAFIEKNYHGAVLPAF